VLFFLPYFVESTLNQFETFNYYKMNIDNIEIRKSTMGYWATLSLAVVRNGEAKSVFQKVINTNRGKYLNTFKHLFPLTIKTWWIIIGYRFNWR
jgi:hypothetical protein